MLSPLPQDQASLDAPAGTTPSVAAPVYATDRRSLRYWLLFPIERHRIIHLPQPPEWVVTRLRCGTKLPRELHWRKPPRGPRPKPVGFGRDVRWEGDLGEETFRLSQPPPHRPLTRFNGRRGGMFTVLEGRMTATRDGGTTIRVRIRPSWLQCLAIPFGAPPLVWLFKFATAETPADVPNPWTFLPWMCLGTSALCLLFSQYYIWLTERELRRVLGLSSTQKPVGRRS